MILKNAEVLNGKKVRHLMKLLEEQWGITEMPECGFLQKGNDVFLITRSVDAIDLRTLNLNSLGLYFAELRNGQLRLSIEGSQIIGKKAKNVISLDDAQIRQWIRGEDVALEPGPSGESRTDSFCIVGNDGDFHGCGRVKEGKLLNFVPKSRRIK